MERNEKVKFTKEGLQEILDSLVVSDKEVGKVAVTANTGAAKVGSADKKEALLNEVVANLIL